LGNLGFQIVPEPKRRHPQQSKRVPDYDKALYRTLMGHTLLRKVGRSEEA
jgi:hypothetical protein